MILSLDPATRCGWAAGAVGEMPVFGVRDFSVRAGNGTGNGAVIGAFRHWLSSRCFEIKPKLICFEAPYIPRFQTRAGGPPPMNVAVLRRLLAIAGTIEAVAWELRIEAREATVGEITKFLTGKARHGGREAKKSATIEMCRRYGFDVGNDDDASDALALWLYAEAIVNPAAHKRRGVGPLFLPPKKERPASGTPRAARTSTGKNGVDRVENLFSDIPGELQSRVSG